MAMFEAITEAIREIAGSIDPSARVHPPEKYGSLWQMVVDGTRKVLVEIDLEPDPVVCITSCETEDQITIDLNNPCSFSRITTSLRSMMQ